MAISRHTILIVLLVIFYTVGIAGLTWDDYQALFLGLTPLNLLLTLGLLKWADRDYGKRAVLAFVIVFLIGFWVEVAGVHTGVLFGEYNYGAPLGWKWLDVPLLIGVNWFLLGYGAAATAAYLVKNQWLKITLAAALMVALDVLIEPVAVQLDFWQWAGGNIPLKNYLMWFVTAWIVQLAFNLVGNRIDRKAGLYVFLIQVYFFALLNALII